MIDLLLNHFSLKYLILGVYLALVVLFYTQRWSINRKIARLGGKAPVIRTYAPFSLDFLYWGVNAFLACSSLGLWEWMFESTGGIAKGSWTAEVMILWNIRAIFTADPDNIKAILATQFSDFGKGELFHREWEIFLGDGIFNVDGEQWHDSRQLIRPLFVRERVGDLDIFETHFRKLLPLLGPGDGRLVHLDRLFFRFSLDSATEFLFGQSAGNLDNRNLDFATAFDEVQRITALRSRLGALRWIMPLKKLKQNLTIMESFIEELITQTLAMSQEELEHKAAKTDTFIHALARFTRDRKVIRDQLVSLLLAGRDTTASTLSWTFLELGRSPQVVRKLKAEIAEHLGTDGRLPTYRDIKDMKYLTHVINETLRLYPVVPYNVRHSLVDTTLPKGGGPDGQSPMGVQASIGIIYSPILMHRRRDLYPPVSKEFPYDPLDWVPDRWDTWQPTPWQFLPFNGGPRICIGQQFAMVGMGYTITRILQNFDGIKDYGNEPVLKAEVILRPGAGVKLGFVKSRGEKV